MNKNKKIFIITITFLMLVGLTTITATDIDNNDTTITQTSQTNTIDTTTPTKTINKDTTTTKEASMNKTDSIQETSNTQETLNNKNGEKTQTLKASRTVTATTYDNLNSYLTSNAYDTITINIGNDIQLRGNITVNSAIKNLTINGNNKTINGNDQYQFLNITHASNSFINNIKIIRCTASKGGAIYTHSNITINNSTLTHNTATHSGGAIYGWLNSNITINNTSFINNHAYVSLNGGGAIAGQTNSTVKISFCDFRDNTAASHGGALEVFGNINIQSSNFTNNSANGTYDTVGTGGAISGTNITINNSNFTNNKAFGQGGAVRGYTKINISYSNFMNNCVTSNKYEGGGAILLARFDTGELYVSHSNFINNSASTSGGAIRLHGTESKAMIETCNFEKNNANQSGGAICTNSNITINNSTLTHNTANQSGGAIYAYGNITINNTNLNNNNANGNTTYMGGGAIYGSRNVIVSHSNLTHNNADYGGAIYGSGNNNITINNTNLNNNNANGNASYMGGGAIYGSRNNNITINNTNITHNTATYGGAIYKGTNNNITINNSTLTHNTATSWNGGAIYGSGNNNITINNTYLTHNTANRDGGAIEVNKNNMIRITNSTLTYNTANSGGAIDGYSDNIITIINSNVTHNTANSYGGAISMPYNNNLTIINTNLTHNNATDAGGAIWGVDNLIITNSILTYNTANSGGAIHAENITINNSNLSYNTANGNASYMGGGAIYGATNTNLIITNSNLTHNNAANEGGAIRYYANLTLTNSNITDNYVTNNKGHVIYFSSTFPVTITNNLFINNTDNVRDMLFCNANKITNVDIHGNTYIDNYLEDSIIKPNVNVVTDNEARSYDYYIDLNLREIYNDTVRNGTLNVYVNGVLKNETNVTNGRARILFGNSDLTKRENNITLEYITLSKHYQNTSTSLILYKEINTTLSIQAPSTMKAGQTAVINFTLKDSNNKPINNEIIHVLVDEEQVATVTTDGNGVATYTFNARGDEVVRIEATHHTSNDSFYLSTMDAVAEINVTKIEQEMVIIPGNIIPHVESNITIHLFDDDGNPIKNKTLTVNITEEGKPDITGTVTTDENGIAVFNFTPTDEGTLNINVTSPSDDIYHYASETIQASKNFITTNMIVSATSMLINQTNTIQVEVLANDGTLLTGTVELDINGEIHTLNINNGRGTYHDYKSSTAGEKLVTAKFTSSIPGYSNATTTEEFNVEKLPTRVTIEAINRTAGNVTLKVLVFPKDDISSIVNGGNIVIESVNGENRKVIYNDTLKNGELINLTDINETGWYDFETEYHGNDYFAGDVNSTGSIEVTLVSTEMTTFDKNALVGETITLNATVTDIDGNPVNDGNVTFHVDGSQLYHADGTPVEAKLENGVATTEYTLPVTYTKGKYLITAKYPGNNKYNMSTGDSELSIETHETSMDVTPVNNTKGNTTIEVTLNTTDDKPIPGAPIIVTDENGTIIGEGVTDENGTANITVDIPTGDNNITITYPGDDTHSPQNETITVNVTPRESDTTGTVTNNTVGNVTIDVEVVDPITGEPVTGPVNIIVDGEVVGNGTLDDEGRATIPVDLDKKGNYTIVVEYEGNDDYNGSNDTLDNVYIAGKDVDMDIVIDNPIVENTTINVTITDPETGEPIPNATINVTLPNGTNVTGTTDENGTAIITIDVPTGDNNITITYPGDDNHETKEENITVKVKSYSVVTVDAVEGVVLDNVTFTANVLDYQDNKVNGGYVVFKVGGKTLTYANGTQIRTPVENGIAKLSYTAESGWLVDSHPNLKVQATYSGTSIVLSGRSDNSKVTIYKRNATVQVSAPDDYVNGTLHIDAVVKDQNGSLINDGNLVFKLNGLSVKDENNKGIVAKVVNGKVHLDVKLPFAYSAKKYNLTAIYSNKIYNKATGTNTTSLKAIPTYINATVTIKDQFSKPVITGQIYNQYNNAILEGTAIINIKFDGISYAKKVKIQNGTFRETLEGIPIYKPGTHKIEIAAGANSHYEAARKTITSKTTPKYNVNTQFIKITRNKTTTRVQAKIIDDKNKNVQKDLKITIKLNGKSFLVNQTVRNGKVDVLVDTSSLKNRNYTLELVSGANTYYNAGKATTELQKY